MHPTFPRLASWLLGAAMVLAATPRPGAQSAAGGSSIDFLAVSRDGTPISDLKAEEVSLKVGGRTLPVRSLRFVPNDARTAPAAAAPDSGLPPPFGTNVKAPAGGGGRAFVLVVDNDSFRVGTERALREAADKFLSALGPGDRVALVNMPYGGTRVDFTTDRDSIRTSLSKIVGQAPSRETTSDTLIRTRRTVESMAGLVAGLRSETAPIVLFFSNSLAAPTTTQAMRNPLGGDVSIASTELRPEVFQELGTAAAASGARVYVIQPVTTDAQVEGLEHVAGVTGGVMLHLGGADDSALSRVARETSGHYVMDFDASGAARNDRPQRVELRVNRPDTTVRVRPELLLARNEKGTPKSAKDLLRVPNEYNDLPLRVTGYASRNTGDEKELKVIALGEVAEATPPALKSAAVGLYDAKGTLKKQWSAEGNELQTGRPIVGGLLAAPGTYRMRLAAVDDKGRVGTADYQLGIGIATAGPLSMSDLVLGVSQQQGGFMPRLSFSSEPVATAYFELYGGKPGMPVGVMFELAKTVDGEAMQTARPVIEPMGDRFQVRGAIPIAALPPGDYIVRAIVVLEGQGEGRVFRTLKKTP